MRFARCTRSCLPHAHVRAFAPRIPLINTEPGDAFVREGRLWVVDKVLGNVKKGKEKAQAAMMLRDLRSGAHKELRVKNQSEKVDVLELRTTECTVLSHHGKELVARPLEEEVPGESAELRVPLEGLGAFAHYVTEGSTVLVRTVVDDDTNDVTVIGLAVPKVVKARVRVVEERAEQADAARATAVLENGRKVKVPAHVEAGAEIAVRMPDELYGGMGDEV